MGRLCGVFRAFFGVSMKTWGVFVRVYEDLGRLRRLWGVFRASLGESLCGSKKISGVTWGVSGRLFLLGRLLTTPWIKNRLKFEKFDVNFEKSVLGL